MASIFILTTASATLLSVVPTACFVIGFVGIVTSFVEQNINAVRDLNEMIRKSDANHVLLIHLFGNIIQDFTDMKQLSTNCVLT